MSYKQIAQLRFENQPDLEVIKYNQSGVSVQKGRQQPVFGVISTAGLLLYCTRHSNTLITLQADGQ